MFSAYVLKFAYFDVEYPYLYTYTSLSTQRLVGCVKFTSDQPTKVMAGSNQSSLGVVVA